MYLSMLMILVLIFSSSSSSAECLVSLDSNDSISELQCKYDNGKKWTPDTLNSYYGESSLTTGEVDDCTHDRFLSFIIPHDGEISFSWMMSSTNQEYFDDINFSFCKNNISIDKCNFMKWSPITSYEVVKGDNLAWIFSLDSPPCHFEGKGWIFFRYNYTTEEPIEKEPNGRIFLDLSPDGASDMTKFVVSLRIEASEVNISTANISINVSDNFNLKKYETEGFLSGASCSLKDKNIEICIINSTNCSSFGYVSAVSELINPSLNSKIWVCLNNISMKDINGTDLKLDRESYCDYYCYGCW